MIRSWASLGALAVFLLGPIVVLFYRDESCHVWTPMHGEMPFSVALYAGLHALISLCYFAIPLYLFVSARGIDGFAVPRWLRKAIYAGVLYTFSCGAEHLLRAFMRPVVYCAEDLWALAVVAFCSVYAAVVISYTSQALIASVAFFGAHPELRPVLEASTPWEAVRELQRARNAEDNSDA